MTATVFVDTNVLVYWREAANPEKQGVADDWLKLLWKQRSGRLSSQVLHEYYVTVTDKLEPGLSRELARRDIRRLLAWLPVAGSGPVLEHAWALQDRYRLPWWDALIAAAARGASCTWLLSEDFQDGQDLDGVRVVNPFLHEPREIAAPQ
ncbi:MAG: PIN domain-containing protein [Gemmatimonadetes bacterium]|nr:PIN domain-containing protein [Gemmatimonadota bacterium]